MDNSVNQPLMMSHIIMHTPGDDGEIDVDETYVGVDKDAGLAYAATSALPPPKPPRTKSKGQLAGLQARRPQQPLVCRVIWGGFASGMVSAVLFLGAMIVYDLSLPLTETAYADPESPDGVEASWLWFWGALLFCLESGIDIAWIVVVGVRARLVASKASAPLLEVSAGFEAAVEDVDLRAPPGVLDRVNWDLLAAIFFFIPSVIYLCESLMDPNVSDNGSMLNPYDEEDVDSATYAYEHLDVTACSLFVIDAVIGLIGRWRSIRATPAKERLAFAQVWKARQLRDIHWCAWGDVFFFLGAVYGLVAHYYYDDLAWQASCFGLWTVDALFYVFGSIPAWHKLVSARA